MTIHKKKGVPYEISLRVSDTPIRDVILSTLDEKASYANQVHDSLREFREYIVGLIEDTKKEREILSDWKS